MKYKALSLCVLLAGCAESPDNSNQLPVQVNTVNFSIENTTKANYTSKYHGDELIKNVNHYAKWLTQDLFANIDFPNNSDVFVVTNFALLDSDLNKTNHFGRQMTEAMIHEVHRTGFSVIDLKASGFIRMTETGDVFYQSKDYLELSPAADASHIITGTLTKHQGGYLINAQVVLLENKALVSSAQIFVPYKVVEAVMLEENDQVVKENNMNGNTNNATNANKAKPVINKSGLSLKAYSQ